MFLPSNLWQYFGTMAASTQDTTTSPLFSAVLRPERSLHAVGGWISWLVAGLVGTPFFIAMPEFVVPGLVAYGTAGATLFGLGVRQGRLRRQSETVTLWTDQLEIAIARHGAERQLRRFDARAVRIRLVRDGYERTTGIFLRHGGEEIELGRFMSVDDKSSFAKAFGGALRQARRAA
jgi:uncharacterized membrane protein